MPSARWRVEHPVICRNAGLEPEPTRLDEDEESADAVPDVRLYRFNTSGQIALWKHQVRQLRCRVSSCEALWIEGRLDDRRAFDVSLVWLGWANNVELVADVRPPLLCCCVPRGGRGLRPHRTHRS